MLALALMAGLAFGIIVIQLLDKEGETIELSLFLLPGIPILFAIAALTGPFHNSLT